MVYGPAQENGLPEPRTEQDNIQLYEMLKSMSSFTKKGPMCKLMRWFSFNESAKAYHGCTSESGEVTGQLWALKMVLEHHFEIAPDDGDAAPQPVLPVSEADPQEELRKLKAQTGALRLAPKLINEDNLWVLDLVMTVSEASWYTYGTKAKHCKSVEDAVQDAVEDQHGKWQDELKHLVAGCLNCSSDRKNFKLLGLLDCNYDQALHKTSMLLDMVLLIIHHRSRSMATQTSLMPHRTSMSLKP